MILTKIHLDSHVGMRHSPMYKDLGDIVSDVMVLVPDEESYHEVRGMQFLLNKVWEVVILEPGTPLSWQGMYTPWHLNTDSYRLSFNEHLAMYQPR